MKMKKIIALAGAGAVLLSMAAPAFGQCYWPYCFKFWDKEVVKVRNESVSIANTGENTQDNVAMANKTAGDAYARSLGHRDIKTGDATARSEAAVVVDTCTGCDMLDYSLASKERTEVRNESYSGANTGDNHQDNYASSKKSGCSSDAKAGSIGRRDIKTGDAKATSKGWTLVDAKVVL